MCRWPDVSLCDVHGIGAYAGSLLHVSLVGFFLGGVQLFLFVGHVFCTSKWLPPYAGRPRLALLGAKFHVHHGDGDHPGDSGVCI